MVATVQRIRRALANGLVLGLSLSIGLLLCELGARLVLNPADYLSVKTVSDDILGITIAPGSTGFDSWGFRNDGVPGSVDVAAIGDSHTYGNNARMTDAWPSVLGRSAGLKFYNFGLGGYGPNQYYYILKTKALTLKPKWVICAIYMGDDFENAYLMTYGKDYWSFLRGGNRPKSDANIWQQPDASAWHKRTRNWLSQHSVVYRLAIHGPAIGALKSAFQVRQASRAKDSAVTSLVLDDSAIREAFRPIGLRDRLDQRSPEVQEGMRITFELLGMMDKMCRENGSRFAVVVIPTKETVFADKLAQVPGLPLKAVVEELVASEKVATERLVQFLDETGIPHVETVSALRERVSEQLYTPSDQDMHPSSKGYHVIGEAVGAFVKQHGANSPE